ncbi:MAG: nucleoid-associated protein, partial [Saprospiraceae bacterium]|nr:nucleoid-associated protein [Saprospiraceae bacterium]
MFNLQDIQIDSIIAHFVGSKAEDEGTKISDTEIDGDDNTFEALKQYFLNPFKPEEYFHLDKDENMYSFIFAIFDDRNILMEQSAKIANYLYDQSEHPKIKPGELFVVYFSNCIVDGEIVDAVGLFKCESKDTFLKVKQYSGGYDIAAESGVNINKLDKGCLIFNTEAENGYLVSVV